MKCKYCDTVFSGSETRCESCGAPKLTAAVAEAGEDVSVMSERWKMIVTVVVSIIAVPMVLAIPIGFIILMSLSISYGYWWFIPLLIVLLYVLQAIFPSKNGGAKIVEKFDGKFED